MSRARTRAAAHALATAIALSALAAACAPETEGSLDPNGAPTPTPSGNPYEACIAHFQVGSGEQRILYWFVLATPYWYTGLVPLDGVNGIAFVDYHYDSDGTQPPDYIAARSTDALVTITADSTDLGAPVSFDIFTEPSWIVTSDGGVAATVTGGTASFTGTFEDVADCPGAACDFGTGDASVAVAGSALTIGSTDGLAVVYCRNLP